MKKLKIAQISTPWESTPPLKYGGTELIASYLTEGLIKKGHKVTLFASGDSKTKAKLVAVWPKALYRTGVLWNDPFYSLLHTVEAFEKASEFDIIHNHFHYFGLSFVNFVNTPVVTTYHGDFKTALTFLSRKKFLQKYRKAYFIAISKAQKKVLPFKMNFVKVIYHGLPLEKFPFSSKCENYLVWLGRITKKKGILEAIKVAKKLGLTLKIGAKIDYVDKEFYETKVKHLIDGRRIQYLGELNFNQKIKVLKNALALLNPISWNEPFGLVMIEAMACGTPVIAFRRGSVPEIVVHNKTGFIVRNVEEMVRAVKKVDQIKREDCRKHVVKKFSVEVMTDNYEKVYRKLIKESKTKK